MLCMQTTTRVSSMWVGNKALDQTLSPRRVGTEEVMLTVIAGVA